MMAEDGINTPSLLYINLPIHIPNQIRPFSPTHSKLSHPIPSPRHVPIWQRESNHRSHLGLRKGDLHLPAREQLIVQVGNGLEAVLHRVELHQRHVLLVRVAQDLDRLDLPVLAEDLVERALFADLFF
jgi:hypothetical protein